MAAGKASLKKQVQRHLIDRGLLDELCADSTEIQMTFPGGTELEICIMQDDDGDSFLGMSVSNPVDN